MRYICVVGETALFNPFQVSGYAGSKYFCNRSSELQRLKEISENNRNVVVYSLRRMGKTSMLRHWMGKLKRKKVLVTYIDIMATNSQKNLIDMLAQNIIETFDNSGQKWIKSIGQTFKKIRPKISIDALTGNPSISIDVKNETDFKHSIDELFSYIKKKSAKNKLVIIIDEFQQIATYESGNTEALLRGKIQEVPNVSFVFSGSVKHMLLNMFVSQNRPFYQSADLMHLVEIDNAEYSKFIGKHFTNAQCKISDNAIELILSITRRHTYYVQLMCNRLYAKHYKVIGEKQVNTTLQAILNENQHLYYNYRNLLTKVQWKLLTAIAKEKEVEQPTSKDFLQTYDLGANSTVQRALNSLLSKEMIFKNETKYMVTDVFLSTWMEALPI